MNRPGIVHMRLGKARGGRHDGMWVSECGHYATEQASTADRELVTCLSCKRTRGFNRRTP